MQIAHGDNPQVFTEQVQGDHTAKPTSDQPPLIPVTSVSGSYLEQSFDLKVMTARHAPSPPPPVSCDQNTVPDTSTASEPTEPSVFKPVMQEPTEMLRDEANPQELSVTQEIQDGDLLYKLWEDNKVPYKSSACSFGSILSHLEQRLTGEVTMGISLERSDSTTVETDKVQIAGHSVRCEPICL